MINTEKTVKTDQEEIKPGWGQVGREDRHHVVGETEKGRRFFYWLFKETPRRKLPG